MLNAVKMIHKGRRGNSPAFPHACGLDVQALKTKCGAGIANFPQAGRRTANDGGMSVEERKLAAGLWDERMVVNVVPERQMQGERPETKTSPRSLYTAAENERMTR